MSLVLHHSKSKGTAKLVLLGIANHEGDGGAWPSVATLMRYANMDRRSVQRAIQKLVEIGELQVLKQKGGNDMTHSALPGFEWMEPDEPMKQPRVASAAPPASPTPPKPSLNSITQLKEETLVIRATETRDRCVRPSGHLMTDDDECFFCGASA